ncbi:MAG: hypothetical protein K6E73_08435 [Bacteroidales bacterium]|nr:hypothetical protein [Bacteroidales bacterium]
MKQIAITLLLCLFCQYSFAQKVTGRWHCTKEVTEQVEMGYNNLYCTYKFRKNGDLTIKIEGEEKFDHSSTSHDRDHIRRGIIRIKGKYTVNEGKISSFVENNDVETYAEEYNPQLEISNVTTASNFVGQNIRESDYRLKKSSYLRKKLLDYRFLWDWDEEPYTVTGKELKIGERLVCER